MLTLCCPLSCIMSYSVIPPTNFFLPGSFSGNERRRLTRRALFATSGFISALLYTSIR